MDGHAWFCEMCRSTYAVTFCMCEDNGTLLCAQCTPSHFSKYPQRQHSTYPVAAYQYRFSPGYFDRLRQRSATFEQACSALKQNLATVDMCIEQVNSAAQLTAAALLDLAAKETAKLQGIKDKLGAQVAASLQEAKDTIFEDTPTLQSAYAALLREPGAECCECRLFTFALKVLEAHSVLQLSYQEKKTVAPVPALVLPRFSRNAVTLHNLETGDCQSFSAKCTYRATFCILSDTEVLSVGGGPPSPSASIFDLTSSKISSLPAMTVARKSPGLIKLDSSVFIFGGNDPSITACEKFAISRRAFAKIADMQYRRAAFWPVAYKGEVYLPDVGQSHRVLEAYSPAADTFRVVAVQVPLSVGGSSVAAVVGGELVLVTGKKQLARVRIDSEQCFSVADLRMANPNSSYSNISPIIVGRSVYWARSTDAALVRLSLDESRLWD